MAELSYAEVARLLKADFAAGKLYWLPRSPDMFEPGSYAPERRCRAWNVKYANTEAFTTVNSGGYLKGAIFNRHFQAHRVIWLLYTGDWPSDQIDHINGIRTDNRIVNLRQASQSENCRNQGRRSDNATGTTGVHWIERERKYQASITIAGRKTSLGYFDNLAKAVAARKAAEPAYGFHENHGQQRGRVICEETFHAEADINPQDTAMTQDA